MSEKKLILTEQEREREELRKITTYTKLKDLGEHGVEGEYVESFVAGEYKSLNHKIKTFDGKFVIINGVKNLNEKMEQVEPGTKIGVSLDRIEKITQGKFKGGERHFAKVVEL